MLGCAGRWYLSARRMEKTDPTGGAPLLLQLPKIDSTLGAYRLVKLLGIGGMGRVYLAENRKSGRKAALKLLHPEYSSDPEIVRRFFNEARAVNQISHPNIVEIVDFAEDPNGFNYFIMELLDGRDLRNVSITDGPFTLERTLEIGKQVASALAAAHAQGIIHRDIKPDNVVLLPRANQPHFVKILDFGIAKLSQGVSPKDQTRLGLVLGTPGHMSPEQAQGRQIDSRSDVYSLGVLLFWMLTDKLPSQCQLPTEPQPQGEPAPEPLRITKRGQPIPPALARLVLRCLCFSADDRVQTMAQVEEELGRLANAPAPRAAPASSVETDELPTILVPILERPVPARKTAPHGRARAASEEATRIRSSTARRVPTATPSTAAELIAALEKPMGRLWLGVIAAAVVVVIGVLAVLNQGPPTPQLRGHAAALRPPSRNATPAGQNSH